MNVSNTDKCYSKSCENEVKEGDGDKVTSKVTVSSDIDTCKSNVNSKEIGSLIDSIVNNTSTCGKTVIKIEIEITK